MRPCSFRSLSSVHCIFIVTNVGPLSVLWRALIDTAMARRVFEVLLAAALATVAVAQDQCIQESGGKSFDLRKANNGKCVTHEILAWCDYVLHCMLITDAGTWSGGCGRSDVSVSMFGGYNSVLNSCKAISNPVDAICPQGTLACQVYSDGSGSFKKMANYISNVHYEGTWLGRTPCTFRSSFLSTYERASLAQCLWRACRDVADG